MRALKVLNSIALLIPLTFTFLSIFDEELLFFAAISTMATGFIQVLTAIFFWIEFPTNYAIKIYFLFVIVFFILIFSKIESDWFWIIPPLLCLYLSILIYSLKSE